MRTWRETGMSRRVVLAVLILPTLAAAADSATLADEIHKLAASPAVGQMKVGIRVVALHGRPQVVFEQDSDQPFKPASNQKLLTSAAAMVLLPPDFTYRTVLAMRGDDLVVIGAGDPSVGDPRMARAAEEPITAVFHQWADRLKAAGITRIKGNLLFDDFIFEQQHVHPSWPGQFKYQMQAWWAAPVGGLNFNDNCVDLIIKPASALGAPAEITLVPNTPWMKLDNRTKTAAKGEPVVNRLGEGPNTIVVSGSVSRPNDPNSPMSIAICDPGAFFASTLRTVLAARGIAVDGDNRRQRVRLSSGAIPKDLSVIATHEQPLKDLLWRVNKSSQNVFAEALLKTIAAHAGGNGPPRIGSYETGREMLESFTQVVGASPAGCVIDDGSGLSHDNRLTPAVLASILIYMDNHPRREEFLDTLAVPGEKEGTLRNRMRSLKDNVFAKTGHINGVSALSGYVVGPGERRYAFSILCNDTSRHKGMSAHRLQDSICQKLTLWDGPVGTASR